MYVTFIPNLERHTISCHKPIGWFDELFTPLYPAPDASFPRSAWDLTIWNLQVDKFNSPFHRKRNGDVFDCDTSTPLTLYKEGREVFAILRSQYTDIDLGIASRIKNIPGAYQLLHLFEIDQFFKYKQIYPGKKIAHLFHLHYRSGVAFKDMLFLDDDVRNIRNLETIGVPTYQVVGGITVEQLHEALQHFSKNYR